MYDRVDENDQPHLCAHLEKMLSAQQVRKVPKSPEQISTVPVFVISTTEAGKIKMSIDVCELLYSL